MQTDDMYDSFLRNIAKGAAIGAVEAIYSSVPRQGWEILDRGSPLFVPKHVDIAVRANLNHLCMLGLLVYKSPGTHGSEVFEQTPLAHIFLKYREETTEK